MSYFEDASLVLIPSAQKLSKIYSVKPTDGTGDLTFTRSNDTATRVGPDGLIEKVRTNLVSYSEQFDNAFWLKRDITVVADSGIAPNGTTTAELVYPTTTGSTRLLEKSFSISAATPYTGTWYLKASGLNWVAVDHIDGNVGAWFNLSTGTIGTISSGTTASIESVGNGWYRCRISKTSGGTTGYHDIRLVDGNNVTSVTANGTNGVLVWGAQLETGDIATDYIATTSAAVSVGPVANVPRLDYLNSSCPRLLLEPQRTNLKLYSENFSAAAGWTASTNGDASVTFTANYGISPDGYQNADRLQLALNTGSFVDWLSYNAVTIGTTYTYSIYAKSLSGSVDVEILGGTPTGNIKKTITTEWTRLTHTFTATSGDLYPRFLLQAGTSSSADILVWGAQLEAGAYATSYIPTLGAAVTRGADAASKTGISSLIGQTEGTLFAEFDFVSGVTANYALLHQAAFSTYIYINQGVSGTIFGQIQPFGISFTVAKPNGRYKCAIAYKPGDSAFFVNGVQVGTTNTTFFTPFTMDILNFTTDPHTNSNRQALLFKTRLTNAQLAELTTL